MKSTNYPKTYGRTRGKRSKLSIINYKKNVINYLFRKISRKKDTVIEIGSGNGDNAVNLANLYKNKLIITCEVYLDGNASLLSKLIRKKIFNVKIFEKNCLFLFEKMNKNSVKEIWILYPDPWPKKKHYKRRLINKKFLLILYSILKNNGKIFIATDDNNYFIDILLEFYKSRLFIWENDKPNKWSKPFKNMAETHFFIKAKKNGRKSNFVIFKKKI